MASSQGNRAKFIQGLMQFMRTYGFDGVDLDWEYPGADDRGGVKADTANYVLFAQELKAAFGGKYGISMTLPTSYWYLQHFDLPGIQPHVDWFNLMAYDLHGIWDAASKFVGPYIAPHTNITEIDLGMDLLWRAGVTPDKVVLGQGWYGRSFTLADPSCNTPNGACRFSGPANPGPCSNAGGILDNQEINDIIAKNGLKPEWDHKDGVKWIMWDSNQWVSYDDADTFKQKRDFANSRCLGGLMVWAMDQVDQKASNGLGPGSNVTPDQQNNAQQMSDDMVAGVTCRTTDCGASCPHGTHKVAETNGQPGKLSTSSRCGKGKDREVCCDAGTTMGKCQWRGYRGAGLSCTSGCSEGETEVLTSTNNHDKKKGDQTCNGGLQSYCCAGFKPAPSKSQLEKKAKDAAKDLAKSAAEQAALDLAAKAFCRVAVPALLAPLELLEDAIPIFGEIADIAEIAATPAIIQGCVKGIEKECKAEFKVFGKKHTLSMDQPKEKPTGARPPKSSHTEPKTSSEDNGCNVKARGLEERVDNCLPPKTEYTATTIIPQTTRKVCDGGRWPQACFHYRSAIRERERMGRRDFNPLTCSEHVPDRNFMQGRVQNAAATKIWADQHNAGWKRWMRRAQGGCQRDEWPPQDFWQGDPGQVVRYNHAKDNQGAGSLWKNFCPEHAEARCLPGSEKRIPPKGRQPATIQCKKEETRKVMLMTFDDGEPLAQQADDGLSANECYPKMLIDDPSFALLNDDSYFRRNGHRPDPRWGAPPPANLIAGRNPPNRKRDISDLNLSELILEDRNSSRRLTLEETNDLTDSFATEEHMRLLGEQLEQLEFVECVEGSCATELPPMFPTSAKTEPSVAEVTATTTTSVVISAIQTQISVAVGRSGLGFPEIPKFTGVAQHEELKLI